MKNSAICARKVRMRRTTKKIISVREMTNVGRACETFSFEVRASSFLRHSSFAPGDDEHIFKVGKIHRGRHPGLAVQFTHLKTLDGADEQAGGKNAADT